MAEALTGLMDYLVTLLQGTASSIDRSIPAKRFEQVKTPVEGYLPRATAAPYPFEIELGSGQWPDNVPTTLAPDRIHWETDLVLSVGYAIDEHDRYATFQTIARDNYAIRRCLGDPDSWSSQSTFVNCRVDAQSAPIVVELPGSETGDGDAEYMWVVEHSLTLTYREDHTA